MSKTNKKLKLIARNKILFSDWDSIVVNSKDGWAFGLSYWLDGLNLINEWDFEDYSFGVYQNNKLLAVVPLHLDKRNHILVSSGFGWSGPIFLAENKKLNEFVFENINEVAKRLNVYKVNLGTAGVSKYVLDINNRGINPWVKYGYKDISSQTQVINFENLSIDELRRGYSELAKRLIRKSKPFCKVEVVKWSEHIDKYYELHKKTYAKSELSPHPYSYFKMIAKFNSPHAFSKLFVARDENNEEIAYHCDLYFYGTAFYICGSSSEKGHKLFAHYMLMSKAIEEAYLRGANYYEVGEVYYGERKKARQISFFKTRFGGELYRLYRGEKMFRLSRMRQVINFLVKIRLFVNKVKSILFFLKRGNNEK